MFRKSSRAVIAALFVLSCIVVPAVNACPGCKYSPSGWGFCQYYQPNGGDWCETKVVDSFTGRTGCEISGECHWSGDDECPPDYNKTYAWNWADRNIGTVLLF